MTWTPPPLQTARLDLFALSAKPQVAFRDQKYKPHDLPGLPSNWTLFLKDGDEGIGSIGFIRWERESALAELGFILKHSERRKGYMSEACRAVIDFGFHHMGLKTVEGRSMPNNVASVGLLEKMGMTKTGCVSARLSQKGACVDLAVYRMAISHTNRAFSP